MQDDKNLWKFYHLSSGVFVLPVITYLQSGKYIKIKTFPEEKIQFSAPTPLMVRKISSSTSEKSHELNPIRN